MGPDWIERLDFDRIAEVINREHPDVVALQEVDSVTQRIGGCDLLGELGKLTGMQQVYAPAISFDGGKYGIGLLCRKKPLASEGYLCQEEKSLGCC